MPTPPPAPAVAHRETRLHVDPIDAIGAAIADAHDEGHDLRGFTRRSGSFGYHFEARCHRCGLTVTIGRSPGGWEPSAAIEACGEPPST